jgi:hypothetical protein
VQDKKARRIKGATDDEMTRCMQNYLQHDPSSDDNELDLIEYALPHHLN